MLEKRHQLNDKFEDVLENNFFFMPLIGNVLRAYPNFFKRLS